ncbi:MAG TPA: hypothetical protein VFE50_18755 [Cyclobacteriaceae bacterium]|nr:hypothetical protein [Cyclobacteriaceae bacterium]
MSEFPAFELDELVEEISQEQLADAVNDGESANWKRTTPEDNRHEVAIQNKMSSDNQVKFMLFRASTRAFVAVRQENAQVSTNEIWEYVYKPNGNHPERWDQYLLTEYKVDSFFNERVILPDGIRGKRAEPYLDYEFNRKGVTISFSKWRFMKDLDGNSLEPEGPLDPALIKYKYHWSWTGERFVEEKLNEAGYDDAMTFTAQVNETATSGDHNCSQAVSTKKAATINVGEWIEFSLRSNAKVGANWQISNGNTKSRTAWEENNRVKKFKVLVDDKFAGYVILANVSAYQTFNFAPHWLKDPPDFKKGTRIRFVIDEVYHGTKNDDPTISHFVPIGKCG